MLKRSATNQKIPPFHQYPTQPGKIEKQYRNYILQPYASRRIYRLQVVSCNRNKAYGETAYQVIMENDLAFITLKYTTDGIEEI